VNRKTLTAALLATAALGASAALSPAIAASEGFSSQEGFNASGAPEWRFELDPYLWLPTTSVNVGLGLLPDKNVSVPVGNVLSHFTGGFMGEGLARYGNWSAEMNLFWVSVGKNHDFTIPDTEGDQVNVRLHSGVFAISPGFGYRIDHTDKLALDARVGFTYLTANASAHIQDSPMAGVSRTSDFAQPWIGERLSYFPSPKWRLVNTLALSGLGVDGGRMGWNGTIAASYLVNSWFDLSLGYRAVQTYKTQSDGPMGQNLSVNILDYGPVLSGGFRF
jgi:hypothetical protein